jgi:energy-coupling factor transporter ATP-binding protein EcfA2
MIIIELACLGVRSFHQVTKLSLKQGLNVISGQTGAGKTTLVECLQVLLFGAPPETLGLPSIPAGNASQAAVTVKVRTGEIYRVIRDFGKGMTQTLIWNTGTRAFAPIVAGASGDPWSAEFDGLPLSEVRSASVWSPRSALPTGAASDAPSWNADDASPSSSPALAALTAEERAAKVSRLAELQGRLARAEQAAQSADEQANAAAREAESRRRLGTLDALAVRRQDAAARKDEMDPFLQGPENLDALLDAYIKAVPAVEQERTELAEQADALAVRVEEADGKPFLKTPMFHAGAGLTGLSFVIALIVPMEGWYRAIFFLGLLAGLGLLVTSLVMDFRRQAAKRAAESALAENRKKSAKLDDRLKRPYAALVALIAQTKSEDADTFKAKRRAAKEWAAGMQAFDQEATAILGGKTRADLETEWQSAKTRVAAFVRERGEDADVESLRDAIRLLTRELDAAPASSPAPNPPPPQSTPSPGAGLAPLRDHAADIARCVTALSGGRIDAVCEQNGSVCVTRRGSPDRVPLDALSSGEALVARLAVALGAWTARRSGLGMPLILDDPLSGLDPEGRAALINALAVTAGERQILLFTNAPVPAAAGITQIALSAA